MQFVWLRTLLVAAVCCFVGSGAYLHRQSVPVRNLSRARASRAENKDFSRVVALTREPSKNQLLEEALKQRGIDTVMLPCISHRLTNNADEVAEALRSKQYDAVIITSPEAASVFVNQWASAGCPDISVVSLGTATSDVLVENGVSRTKIWQPSLAYASTLVLELPDGFAKKYLYPCSALARPTLTSGLRERGLDFTAIPAYTTVPYPWKEADVDMAKHVKFAAVASPSAVKAWKYRAGTHAAMLCIGRTTADAALEEGFKRVTYAKSPTFNDWVDKIVEVVEQDYELLKYQTTR